MRCRDELRTSDFNSNFNPSAGGIKVMDAKHYRSLLAGRMGSTVSFGLAASAVHAVKFGVCESEHIRNEEWLLITSNLKKTYENTLKRDISDLETNTICTLRQRPLLGLRLLEPEAHIHVVIHCDPGRKVLLGLGPIAATPVELAEPDVAARDERAHTQLLG